jgi:hypothetical protein
MRYPIRFGLTGLTTATLLLLGCLPGGNEGASGSTTAKGGDGSGGTGGAVGSGGGTAGTDDKAGSGGATSGGGSGSGGVVASGGSNPDATGGAGSGGTTTSAGGATTGGGSGTARTGGAAGNAGGGSGGSAFGTGGRSSGGTTGTGGARAGSGGGGGATSGATGGQSGTSTGGTTGGGGSDTGGGAVATGDDFVSDVKVAVHPNTNTILVVTWTQIKAADDTLLEFSFAGSSVMTSRPQAGATGSHRDVVLGVPEKTAVTLRIVSKLGTTDYKTKDYQGTTGALPSGLPKPTLLSYDAALASPEPWLLGAVDSSPGGCGNPTCYYISTFWIYIMDRQARIVWYWADPSDNASSAYPRVARDGEYLVVDKGRQGNTGVVKMTLDRQYYQFVAIKNLDDAMDVTTDGSVLYDVMGDLKELTWAGTTRNIWSCRQTFRTFENCYSNTVNWNAAADTVMLSFPDDGTVVEIDRQTGTLVGQYGNASGSYAFSPSTWKFQYPHSPNLTPQGTLILSTHLPPYPFGTPAAPQHHAFAEFTIDRTAKQLTEKWVYSDGTEWSMFKGFAIRLANGNTLGNYGTGGVIREITPDKQTAFHVSFPVAGGDGYDNRMVGNTMFVPDLYALNGGGPK